ncbi:hypothetical protein CHLRE_09g397098v5 [Chlamydomonas reinhardtii]|uniref:Uncharacterized protein n=1 Tax=Chlamydomonas reinhardtii TaxID=3055 RepID=A0A2K3DD37_CHLRE|nr:uncharacterized protein CHLRE_09g397098v5 [Chlamydomonas reinhardtii]PNW78445.1 hypothetical protein CHLRE_09g397098v5 [Chlamydomonas reinhardtii]
MSGETEWQGCKFETASSQTIGAVLAHDDIGKAGGCDLTAAGTEAGMGSSGGLALLSAAVGGLLLLLALVLDRGVSKVDGAVQYIRAGIYRAQ